MKITQEVMLVLDECRVDGGKLYLPERQLDRKLYVAVDKVLKLLGGKWNRKERAHLFGQPIREKFDAVILTGEICDLQKELQFFETPVEVVEELLAGIPQGATVLEPSAGKGAIVRGLLDRGYEVVACEQHDPFRDTLRDFQNSGKFSMMEERDFLTVNPDDYVPFDAVVANPPFTGQQDVDHVSHMIDFLKKGGRLATVMSNGVTFRQTKKTLALIEKLNEMEMFEITPLPEGAFKASGTNVNTVLVKGVKTR